MKDFATKWAERLAVKIIRARGKKLSKETKDKIIELLRQDFVDRMTLKYPNPEQSQILNQ